MIKRFTNYSFKDFSELKGKLDIYQGGSGSTNCANAYKLLIEDVDSLHLIKSILKYRLSSDSVC